MYEHRRAKDPFLDPPLGPAEVSTAPSPVLALGLLWRRREGHRGNQCDPWKAETNCGNRQNTQTPDSTLSNLHLRPVSPNSCSQAQPSSSSLFRNHSLRHPPASPRPPTHPATRMMTRSGSPATVIKKSAKAGPKATKVHPKNTAAPMAGQLGAGWRPGQELRMGVRTNGQLGSPWGGDATP